VAGEPDGRAGGGDVDAHGEGFGDRQGPGEIGQQGGRAGVGLGRVGVEEEAGGDGGDACARVEPAAGVGAVEVAKPVEQGRRDAPGEGDGSGLLGHPVELGDQSLAVALILLDAAFEPGVVLGEGPDAVGVGRGALGEVAVLGPEPQGRILEPVVVGLHGLGEFPAVVQPGLRHGRAARGHPEGQHQAEAAGGPGDRPGRLRHLGLRLRSGHAARIVRDPGVERRSVAAGGQPPSRPASPLTRPEAGVSPWNP